VEGVEVPVLSAGPPIRPAVVLGALDYNQIFRVHQHTTQAEVAAQETRDPQVVLKLLVLAAMGEVELETILRLPQQRVHRILVVVAAAEHFLEVRPQPEVRALQLLVMQTPTQLLVQRPATQM
jgi:hypothetical protein